MLCAVASWRASQAADDPANLNAMTAATYLGAIARGIERDVSTSTLLQAADVLTRPGGLARAYAVVLAVGDGPVLLEAEQFLGSLIAER